METEAMRKELKEMIEKGDDTFVETLHEVAKDYNESFELSEEEMAELNRRREEYLSGKGISYTWQEAMDIIKQKRTIQ